MKDLHSFNEQVFHFAIKRKLFTFMLKFDIITIFPEIFSGFLDESLIKKAQDNKRLKISIHDLRDWAKDRRRTIDDSPYGGGSGMVMKVEPVFQAISKLAKLKASGKKIRPVKKNCQVVSFSPRGRQFTQQIASRLSKLDQIILLCSRYEGLDERVAQNIVDLELSMGDFDLMGGEVPAMAVIEAVSRLIPGVIGNKNLLKERIGIERGFFEYAQYTRPEVFCPKKGICWKTPKVLLSGDPKKIGEWRKKHGRIIGDKKAHS